MSVKKKIFDYLNKMYYSLPKFIPGYLGKEFCSNASEKLVPIDEIETKYGKLKFYCFGKLSLWRTKTFFNKEPETIEWINSMKKGENLWDIGANIGLYSIYAGKKGVKVFAFEPSSMNLFPLSKNINLNNLSNNVLLYPIAVSDKNEFGFLNMSNITVGGALHIFSSKNMNVFKQGNNEKEIVTKQGMFSYSIDELVEKYNFEVPNYIKIDVDGIEEKIIYGSNKTLSNKNLKSILVELDENDKTTGKIVDFLNSKGFSLKKKTHSDMIENGEWENVYNYIFWR